MVEAREIKTRDREIKAFLEVFDQPLQTEKEGPLAGLSFSIKDNILIKGQEVTAGSKILKGHRSAYQATVVDRLLAAGATIVGRTNLDEFAMGSSTENSAWQTTLNPWDMSKVPGGSSGGAAAAVANNCCDVSLGSDTGGSIRQPAAFCGLTALKPTYGAVSRYGLVALASSLDQIGPIARQAENVEKTFAVICGQDKNDQTTLEYAYQNKDFDFKGLRIGLPKQLWQVELDPAVKDRVEGFVAWLKDRGTKVESTDMPSLVHGLSAYHVILPAEASTNLARYDGIRYSHFEAADSLLERYLKTRSLGFGPEVKRRILIGTYVLSVGHFDQYYNAANKAKELIKQEYQRAFDQFDLLISPTTPTLPFDIGSRTKDPLKMYQADLLTVSANLAGLPALALPCGFSPSNLPISAQLIGNYNQENLLFDVAKKYQKETDFHLKEPDNG